MYALGIDLGSSSVKLSLVSIESGRLICFEQVPSDGEMPISAARPGWAEQSPSMWWQLVCDGIQQIIAKSDVHPEVIRCIGIAYQMHGLVAVDSQRNPLRDAIIWCDSRAITTGREAVARTGRKPWLENCLNEPGNFTASRLAWLKANEPDIHEQIYKVMLPGDYIAMRLTGDVTTTISGLSEAVLWDFSQHALSDFALDSLGLESSLIPDTVPAFSIQGRVHREAARQTGLLAGTPVSYRAGDQPNNALALGALEPGDLAATCGTSGVVYGVTDKIQVDPTGRVNAFAHVNHTADHTRIGILLCVNGAGIAHSWMKNHICAPQSTYDDIEAMMGTVPRGADGLFVLPFGNGAERMLGNRNLGARIYGLDFNRHERAHLLRAAVEGVAFSFVYGIGLLSVCGIDAGAIRVGNDNLFQSEVFGQTIADLTGCTIDVLDATGATGAARAAAYGAGLRVQLQSEADQQPVKQYSPGTKIERLESHYNKWLVQLESLLG